MIEQISPDAVSSRVDPHLGSRQKRLTYAFIVAVIVTIIAAFFLFLFWDKAGGLWRDEINSINFANLSTLAELWRHLDNESFPLLWILIERTWSPLLGTSDTAVRAVGLATGLAMLATIWLSARRCNYVPMLALAMIADNPVLLRSTAINRAYGLSFILVVLLYAAAWKLSQQPTRRRLLVTGILALLLTQTFYFGIVFVAAMLIGALAVRWQRGDWKILGPLAAIGGLCVLSLVPYVLGPIHSERSWSFLVGYKMPPWQVMDVVGQALHLQSQYQPCTGGTIIATLVWIGVGALCVYGLTAYVPRAASRWEDGGDTARFASVAVLVSLAGNALVLSVVGYMIEPFHLSALTLLIAVAASHLGSNIRPVWIARTLIPTLALLVPGTNLLQTFRAVQVRQTNADLIAGVVNARAQPGDFVLVAPYWLGQPFARYYHGRAPWTTVPTIGQYAYGGENYILDHMLHPTPGMAHMPEIETTLRSGHSVWLVDDVDQFPSVPSATSLLPTLPAYPPDTRANFHDFLERLMQQDAFVLHYARQDETITVPQQPVNPEEHLEINRYSLWGGPDRAQWQATLRKVQ